LSDLRRGGGERENRKTVETKPKSELVRRGSKVGAIWGGLVTLAGSFKSRGKDGGKNAISNYREFREH